MCASILSLADIIKQNTEKKEKKMSKRKKKRAEKKAKKAQEVRNKCTWSFIKHNNLLDQNLTEKLLKAPGFVQKRLEKGATQVGVGVAKASHWGLSKYKNTNQYKQVSLTGVLFIA